MAASWAALACPENGAGRAPAGTTAGLLTSPALNCATSAPARVSSSSSFGANRGGRGHSFLARGTDPSQSPEDKAKLQ